MYPWNTLPGTVPLSKLRAEPMADSVLWRREKNKLIDETSTVVADVENDSLLANLWEVLFYELVQALFAHVGEIDVSNLAAAGSVHFFAVGFDHVELVQCVFVADRLYRDGTRSLLG